MCPLPYLAAYPEELQARAESLLRAEGVADYLATRYPERHAIRTSKALAVYVQELKAKHMRKAAPLGKVFYDDRLFAGDALGLHVTTTRIQGANLRKRRELRIASLFKEVPAAFLRMIVVHELAHMKHAEHDRDFYRLCTFMEPDYAQLEFDLRLHLTAVEWTG